MPEDAPARGRDENTVGFSSGWEVFLPFHLCFCVRMQLVDLMRSMPTPDLGGSGKNPIPAQPLNCFWSAWAYTGNFQRKVIHMSRQVQSTTVQEKV